MNGHMEGPQLLLEAACSSRLLPHKHPAPVSPLECALPQFPATVHSKQLTRSANFFRMRSYAKTGGRGPHSFPSSRPTFTPKETSRVHLIGPANRESPSFPSFSFQQLTNCPICKPSVLKTLQQYRGCGRIRRGVSFKNYFNSSRM